MKLTEKQKRFIDYYIETGNATEAAKKAGYRGNNLNRIGSENLSKLDLEIKKKLNRKEKTRIASQDEVLEELTKIARSKITDFLKVDDYEVVVGYEEKENGELDIDNPIKKTIRGVEIFKTNEMPEESIGAIASIKEGKAGIELRLHDKVRALELLAKRYGLDKLVIESDERVKIVDDISKT